MKRHLLLAKLIFCLISILQIPNFNAQNNYSTDYLVVRLNHKYLDFNKVDDEAFDNTNLAAFLNSQGKFELQRLKDTLIDLGSLELEKIFSNLKTKDSISISRLGSKVSIPPFWATFKIEVPKTMSYWSFF